MIPRGLDPELAEHLRIDEPLALVHHPLMVAYVHEGGVGALNAALAAKRTALAQAEEHEDWERYLYLHERPYRPRVLCDIAARVSDECYWRAVRELWIDTEFPGANQGDWDRLLGCDRPGAHLMMDDTEAARLSELGPRVVAYRGIAQLAWADGLSWSIDPEVAARFAARFARDGRGVVIRAELAAERVLAYLGSRGESELVLHPAMRDALTWERVA